ncbi:MAG: heavy metal translocating P-type ATPase [Synergistaceae bacterium]|nr:heavy metal translocating P-type ATPase [Synergistaceae bacterium]
MNKKQRSMLLRIIAAALMLIALNYYLPEDAPINSFVRLALYLVPYLIVGHDILIKAFKGIKHGQIFDENFLMAVATLGALALALYYNNDYTEAIAVMLFYQTGELFQGYAVGKSRRSISDLMDIRPDYANIENAETGELEQVDPDEVEIGSVIVVQAGEKIPIDGIITEGSSSLNTSALTGESVPRDVKTGDEVISGCINLNGLLKVKTTREFGESTASKILDLVENASSRKSKSENFITKFARVYTPAVCISALALAIFPPLVNLLVLNTAPEWGQWIYRALTFLVISCPCALVISIPLSFFAGLGGASRAGILIKGSNYLETLSQVKCVVFDKTGTLTQGVFDVSAVHPDHDKSSEFHDEIISHMSEHDHEHHEHHAHGAGLSDEELLHLTAHVERYSTHPIASSQRKAYPHEADDCVIENVEELSGYGIRAMVNGDEVCVGNFRMMDELGIKWHECHKTGTVIHVAINGEYAGHVIISDVAKRGAKEAISELKDAGVERVVMLTGDAKPVATEVAENLGITEFHAELLPAGKVIEVEKLLAYYKKSQGKLAFVGDGINDAPVLSRADVGIAMGAMGSDAAIEAADVVLMDDDPLKTAKAIKIAKKCMRIVYQNIYFSIGVKLLCLLLGALGLANMWLAVFADVGVMLIAVLNAIRALLVKNI